MMVEGGGHEISEEDFLGAVEFGHEEIKKIVKAIDKLAKKAGKKSATFRAEVRSRAQSVGREELQERRRQGHAGRRKGRAQRAIGKLTREEALARLTKKDEALRAQLEDPSNKDFDKIIKQMEEEELRVMVVDERFVPTAASPTRSADLVEGALRAARSRLGPVHARADAGLHRRDLGSISDEQRLDGIMAIPNKRYMHYYNFPPYSVGETRPMRARAGAKSATATSRNARSCRCCRRSRNSPTRCA
jgi:polyribonucleotide nucleotidyltransferase